MNIECTILDSITRFEQRAGYRPNNLQAALIDMDGTLYDSMPWHARAWHRMVTELGIEASVDEFFSYEGMTGKATINLLMQRAFGRTVSDEEADELYRRKTVYFQTENQADIMPGARDMVASFRNAGVTPVLVTGSGQATLLSRLTDDFDGAFPPELRVTSRDVKNGKPSPEPYLAAMQLVGVAPIHAVVVENAPLGVRAGVAAGVFTIAVKTGPIPLEQLREAGADVVFNSMPQCAEFIPRIVDIMNEHH